MSDKVYILAAVNAATGYTNIINSFSNEDTAIAYKEIFDEVDTLHVDSFVQETDLFDSIPETNAMYRIIAVGSTIVLDRVLELEGTSEEVGNYSVDTEDGKIQSIFGLVYERDQAEELVEELAAQIRSHGMTPEIIRNSSEELNR